MPVFNAGLRCLPCCGNESDSSSHELETPPPIHSSAASSIRQPASLVNHEPSPVASGSLHSVQGATPEAKTVYAQLYKFRHPVHGRVSVKREKKEANAGVMTFNMTLSHAGSRYTHRQDMRVMNSDADHHGASTLGYGDIELPEAMQNRGLSYLLHFAAAEAAQLLGVEKFTIDNVVSPNMENACQRLGMKVDGAYAGHYSTTPEALKQASRAGIQPKGWSGGGR